MGGGLWRSCGGTSGSGIFMLSFCRSRMARPFSTSSCILATANSILGSMAEAAT